MARKVKATPKEKTLGEISDEVYLAKQELKEVNARASELKMKISELELQAIQMLEAQETSTARGKVGRVTLMPHMSWKIDDWSTFTGWALKNKALHFFERRVSNTAVNEYLEGHPKVKEVPGLAKNEWTSLSVGKAS